MPTMRSIRIEQKGGRRSSGEDRITNAAHSDAESHSSARKHDDWTPTTHEVMIMIVLSLVSLMVSLDACIIVTSLANIVIDLHGTTTQGFWVGTSYLLTNAVTMPFIAALSDIFGRPFFLILSLISFTIGTLVCCLAHTMGVLLVGRSLQGIGGGGIIILSLVIFTDIVPLRHRPKWYGTVLGAWALGNCLGPICGGLIVEHTTWRWIFYIMFPFCALGLIAVPLLLTLAPRTATIGEKMRRVDWVGGALFMASATSFLVAISWGGTEYAWYTTSTLVPLCLGILGLAMAMVWEAYFAQEPFLPHSLFNSRSAVATYICGAIQGLVIYGQLYYGPFYFMSVKGYSPVNTGLSLFPVMFTLVPGSIVTGALVTRLNNFRWAIWLGWALCTVATGLMITFDAETPVAHWVVVLVILGFGHGAVLNAQNFATQAMCKPGEEAAAAGMYGFLRQFGTALGVGIGGTAFQNIMKLKLQWDHLPEQIASESEAFVFVLKAMEPGVQKTTIINAYVYGFRGVNAVYLGLAALAFFLSLLIKYYDMNKTIETEHRLRDSRFSSHVSKLFEGGSGATTPAVRTSRMTQASPRSSSMAPPAPAARVYRSAPSPTV